MEADKGLSVTQLLLIWRNGDDGARDRLIPLVYEELWRLARRELHGERKHHTLASKDLLHEAYIRLIDADISWEDRSHFFAVAVGTMRRVLVDHARARNALKRGAGATMLSLDDACAEDGSAAAPAGGSGSAAGAAQQLDVLMLDQALTRLGTVDERMERIVELHFFGGMTYNEVAATTGLSAATIHRDLSFAKAWLRQLLEYGWTRKKSPRGPLV